MAKELELDRVKFMEENKMKDCTQCKHLNKDCDKNYKTCILYIQISMINKAIDDFNKKRKMEMTKITQDTELKAGMKVKINDEIRTIIEYSGTGEQKLNELRDILIAKNAELIEDNAKVVVSDEVGKFLQKCERERKDKSFAIWLAELEAKISVGYTVWTNKHNLPPSKIANIYENGWEVEKPKRWEAKEGEKVWFVSIDGTVSNLIESGFTRRVISDLFKSGNHFQTKEEAEAKAKQIRAVLRGEG